MDISTIPTHICFYEYLDAFFVGQVSAMKSMHQITRTKTKPTSIPSKKKQNENNNYKIQQWNQNKQNQEKGIDLNSRENQSGMPLLPFREIFPHIRGRSGDIRFRPIRFI